MRVRRTSRLILLDDRDRVLLFEVEVEVEDATVFRPEEPSLIRYWVTPGGSLEAGEGHEDAARRELWEETGMAGVEPGPWVALCEAVLSWAGETIRVHDRFYLARVDDTVVTLDNLSQAEREVYRDHRWWVVDELRSSDERVVPPGLVDLFAQIVTGDMPPGPVRLG